MKKTLCLFSNNSFRFAHLRFAQMSSAPLEITSCNVTKISLLLRKWMSPGAEKQIFSVLSTDILHVTIFFDYKNILVCYWKNGLYLVSPGAEKQKISVLSTIEILHVTIFYDYSNIL